MRTSLSVFLLLVSAVPQASYAQSGDIYGLAGGILALINNFVIPFLLSLAVLFFIYQILRYFILESDNIAGRQQARSFAYYGLLALVFIIAFWGIIAFVIRGFGFATEQTCYPAPDFFFSDGVICTNSPTIQPQPEAPAESPSVDIPPSIPAGDGTNGDTTPTLPGGLQPPSSGDDQPNIGNDVPDYTQTANIMQQRQALAEAANELIDTRFEDLFGDNSDTIAAELLTPLTDTAGTYNDLDRLQAAYWLEQLDGIETQQLQDYLEIVNTQRTNSELEPISLSDIIVTVPNETEPPRGNTDALANPLRNELQNASSQPLNEQTVNDIVNDIYQPGQTLEQMEAKIDDLYFGNNSVLTISNSGALLDQYENAFRTDSNTANLYQGNFSALY